MRIVIMRHGKPNFDLESIKSHWMPASYVGEIVNNYKLSTLNSSYSPKLDSLKLAKECALMISSDLPRAILSVKLLDPEKRNISESCFQESALPYLKWSFPKLTFFTWAIIFRLLWLGGFSRNGESFKNAKLRSKLGVDKLEHHANEAKSVLLLGHGIMNRLLIKELKRRKWEIKKKTGEKYWSYTILEYAT